MSIKSIKLISFLWVGSIAGAGCAFVTQVLLARSLGAEEYGTLMAALMIVAVLTPIAVFGVPQFWLKVFGKERVGAVRWLAPSLRFFVLSALSVWMISALWALLGPHNLLMRDMLLILSLYFLGQSVVELLIGKCQIVENYYGVFWWQLLPYVCRLLYILFLVFFLSSRLDLVTVVLGYSAIAVVFVFVGACSFRNTLSEGIHLEECKAGVLRQEVKPAMSDVFSGAWPFGLVGIFNYIYFQSDIVLVKYIAGGEAAGHYSVAVSVMAAVYLLPTVVYQKFLLPKLHRWSNHDHEKFISMYYKGSAVMFVLGVAAMLIIWVGAHWAIPILFGDSYRDSIVLINILALCVPLQFLASSAGASLVTQSNMRRKVIYMGGVAVFNIVMNAILIPRFGAAGAAVATVLSSVFLLALYSIAVKKFVLLKR